VRKLKKTIGVAATAAALTLTGIASANAINRVDCTDNNYLWLSSAATTCWANAGTVNVKLFGVYGFSTGQNAGTIVSLHRRQVFSKNGVGNWDKNDTVTQLTIN